MTSNAKSVGTSGDLNGLIKELQAYVDDPMWVAHAEVPKALLRRSITVLLTKQNEVDSWIEKANELSWRISNIRDQF